MQEQSSQPVAFLQDSSRPVTCYFREEQDGSGGDTDVLEADEKEKEVERGLRCAACNHLITSRTELCSQAGKNHHTFFNPAGIVYEISCFRNAPGCLIYGARSTEFSWFVDHSWQICYCGGCMEHLGWYFSSATDGFYGLIFNRLVED